MESGGEIKVGVANKFVDQRELTPISSFEYSAFIFDYDEADVYSLLIYDDGEMVSKTMWNEQSQTIVTPEFVNVDSVEYKLFVSHDNGSQFMAFGGDWALYQGYVTSGGTTDVEMVVRTSPEGVSPDAPKSFGGHYVSGADEGMTFTLLEGTTLTPYFAAYPGVGAKVEFEDLAQLGVYQSSVIEAVQQLFNLRFLTDHMERTVYIEPLDSLYDSNPIWDWSGKIIEGTDVLFEDMANDVYKSRRWGYQQADGVTTRSQEFGYIPGETYPDAPEEFPSQSVNDSWSDEFGSWSFEIDNYGAKQAVKSTLNPLFSPTLNDTTGLPIVGDRDDEELVDTLEFSPRIVSFLRMQSSGNDTIPYVAFHSPEDDFTLCFEDRDGVSGLNRFYEDQLKRDVKEQYITLSLALSPLDILGLLSYVDGMASALSRFAFEIDGEWCECRLEAILSYDLSCGVARCKFHTIN